MKNDNGVIQDDDFESKMTTSTSSDDDFE